MCFTFKFLLPFRTSDTTLSVAKMPTRSLFFKIIGRHQFLNDLDSGCGANLVGPLFEILDKKHQQFVKLFLFRRKVVPSLIELMQDGDETPIEFFVCTTCGCASESSDE